LLTVSGGGDEIEMGVRRRGAALDLSREELLAAAREAAANAYCPYSKFHVGAAVAAAGKIYTGVNVENASYGLTLCAERAALAAAITAGAREITDIAVACIDASLGLEERMPCGACRQWLAELAPHARIHILGAKKTYTLEELLPYSFKLQKIKLK